MKLSLITMQGVYNYGSALQTYASQKILTDLGCEVEIVDLSLQRFHDIMFCINNIDIMKPFLYNRGREKYLKH